MTTKRPPPFREDQPADEQAARRKAGLDCHYCGYPIRAGRARVLAVGITEQLFHPACARIWGART